MTDYTPFFADIITQTLANGFTSVSDSKFICPKTDLVTEGKKLIFYIEAPGIDEKSLDINCLNNQLTVKANKNKNYTLSSQLREIKYGIIKREYILPCAITKPQSVKASYKNGIITITINLADEEENRFSVRINQENE